ncbi:MAG: winged helix-turn-helix domain-containing protein [Fimbriimonadaceae bacterium]|nr:winged helix-turn-helix domain-containing protein [Fimbriimonadaceae bacterium]QYK54954.1 MAG: winged helix-turn-helix domain-containing protein [Fimbriimonadaceae bacterium]
MQQTMTGSEFAVKTGDGLKVPVLVVEDDEAIRRLLNAALLETEFKMTECGSAVQGLTTASKLRPELVLLDLGLPDLNGVEFVEQFRGWSQAPIIIVSAQDDEDKKVAALEAGADDYVTKPFGVSELLARMRAAWRRYQSGGQDTSLPVIEMGDVQIDIAARRVMKGGDQIHLTPIEYKLLVLLAKHAGRVVTQRQILAEVWGDEYSEESQYLRVYVGYLRKKLEDDPSNPNLILTEPRVGYRIRA